MPKIKTKKSISKRFSLTKNKKVMKRADGQDHFNARQSGKTKRNKRTDNVLAKTGIRKTIIRTLSN